MAEFTIRVATARRDMDEIRPALDEALALAFPSGLLTRTWEGRRLRLAGPGARGSIALENGHLVGRAHLEAPATLMQDTIQRRVAAALRRAAG